MSEKVLENQVALITGGSRGIGRAIATKLGSLGAKIAINYSSNSALAEESATMALSAGAQEVEIFQADVSQASEAKRLAEEVQKRFGDVHILVNNAGVQRSVLLHKMSDLDWHQVMDVNVSSAFYLCRAILPTMLAAKSGNIVNIGSASGFTAHKGAASYCASKYALIGLTKVLALETADKGIRVNGVAPGITDTDMIKGLTNNAREGLLASIPMKRMAQAEEIANMVKFIITEATYSTGNFFHISGGFIMN